MLKGYIVIRRGAGYSGAVDNYEVDTNKPITGELIRVLKEYNITLSEGDTITFESK